MKKVVLKSIRLENWSGKSLSVDFNDRETTIKGRNEIGKTSIICAWRWLLTGRVDVIHPANYEIFDTRVPLSPDTPEAVVEAVVVLSDGTETSIKKKAKAAFTRPKGKSEYVKSASDKYTTYIDGVETNATHFSEWIEANICPVQMLPYCMDGMFFSTLCEDDKKKARNVLQNIVGEINNDDFEGDYDKIIPLMTKNSVEQIIDIYKSKQTALNRTLDDIPTIISTKESMYAEMMEYDFDLCLENINNTKQRIDDIDNEITGASDSIQPILDERREIMEKISDARSKLNAAWCEHDDAIKRSRGEYKNQLHDIDSKNEEIVRFNNGLMDKRKRLEDKIAVDKSRIELHKKKRLELLAMRDSVKSQVFSEEVCPTCGQRLPESQIEEALERFNTEQRRRIDEIVRLGKENNDITLRYIDEMASLEKEISEIEEPKALLSKNEILKAADEAAEKEVHFEDTDTYLKMKADIEALEATLPSVPKTDTENLTMEKQNLMVELEGLNRKYGLKEQAESLSKEIDCLKDRQKEIGSDLANCEEIIAQCKDWIEERANIISNRINDKLNSCKIQMWTVQKNGERVPDCVILDKGGVKYGKTNTAEKIKIDVELQKMFMIAYDVELITFMDEASVFSSFNIPKLDNQHVLIFASDDKYLMVN